MEEAARNILLRATEMRWGSPPYWMRRNNDWRRLKKRVAAKSGGKEVDLSWMELCRDLASYENENARFEEQMKELDRQEALLGGWVVCCSTLWLGLCLALGLAMGFAGD
ncbi:hypothetical protein ACHAXT_011484 [Thalassiosira profunda]